VSFFCPFIIKNILFLLKENKEKFMENIQIINTKEMNDWVQIVFDYDEKTFFYFKENLGDNENIYL